MSSVFTAVAGVVVIMDLSRRPEILMSGHPFGPFYRKLSPEGLSLFPETFPETHSHICIQVFTCHSYFACPVHFFVITPIDEM